MHSLTFENRLTWKSIHPEWWHIPVFENEDVWFKEKAHERNENGKRLGMISKTKDTTDSHNYFGIAGEWAAGLVYNLPIGRITGRTKSELNQGDLGSFIEVKCSRDPEIYRWDLMVNEDQLKLDHAYVSVLGCLLPKFLILTGWTWGHEIKSMGDKRKHSFTGHPIFRFERKYLKKPMSLFDEIRRRV